jgi:pilus assembly protein CpaF
MNSTWSESRHSFRFFVRNWNLEQLSSTKTCDEFQHECKGCGRLPFLRRIEPLILSEIMVNADRAVFVEKLGQLLLVAGVTIDEKFLQIAVRNITRSLNTDISEEDSVLDARLPDGSSVAIVLSPVSVSGATISIRKFQNQRYTADEPVRVETLSAGMLSLLQQAVRHRQIILISGRAGTGKTTLLNGLAAFIPDDERVLIIDDTSEIRMDKSKPGAARSPRRAAGFAASHQTPIAKGDVALATGPYSFGEVRGPEAFDLLQAMSTGHQGTLATTQANSAAQSLTRIATCAPMSGIEIAHRVVRANIGEALKVLVHLERRRGQRLVTRSFASEVTTVPKTYSIWNDLYKSINKGKVLEGDA